MRAILLIPALALICTAAADVASDDSALLSLVSARRDKMVRVTDKPRSMDPPVIMACAPMSFSPQSLSGSSQSPVASNNPHEGKFYHVYISKPGLDVLKSGKGTYPAGTMVLKEKFSDASGKTTELFTAMVKREKGFNPKGGDWEYFVLSGDARKIEQRGKIESCMSCHDSYESTDFVTRDYMDHP